MDTVLEYIKIIYAYLLTSLNAVTLVAGLSFTVAIVLVYFLYSRSRTLLSYIPNIWTSLGILGTFIAIVHTLESADIYDADKMVDMSKLIGNIVPAFTTSIIGIVGAIISSLGVKVIFAIEDENYEENNKWRSSYRLTPELMLDGILRNTKETKDRLDGIIHKISEGVLEETNKVISEKVATLLEEHGKIIAGVFEEESELLKSTVFGLSQGVKEDTERMVAEYKNLSSEVSEALARNSSEVTSSYSEICGQLRASVEATTEDMKQTLAEQSSIFRSETQRNTTEIVNRMNQMSAELAAKQKENSDSYVESLNVIHQSAADSAAELQDSISQRFESFTSGLVAECEELQKAIITASVTDGKAIIAGINQQVEAVVEEYKKLAASLETNLEDSVSDVLNDFVATSQKLRQVGMDLGSVAEKITTAMNDYNAMTASAQEILKSLGAAENKLADMINAHDPTDEQMKKALSSMEELSEALYRLNYRIEAMKGGNAGEPRKHVAKCPNCGAESTNPMANFCGHCGHALFIN